MSTYRSDRSRRRATRLRTTRILIVSIAIIILTVGAYLIFTERNPEPVATGGENMITTNSGLMYEDLVVGDGAEAVQGKNVSVHYTGWLEDGTKFDSSLDRGQPFTFLLGAGNVIQGWEEGVAGMKSGGKRRLVIPPELGYGSTGAGGVIPPNATLIFEVELLGVQ